MFSTGATVSLSLDNTHQNLERERERERMNVPKDNEGLEDQFMNEKFIQFQTGCEDERDPTACYSLGEWYAVTSQNYDKARYVVVVVVSTFCVRIHFLNEM